MKKYSAYQDWLRIYWKSMKINKILGMKRQGSTEIKEEEALYDASVSSVQQLTTSVKKSSSNL